MRAANNEMEWTFEEEIIIFRLHGYSDRAAKSLEGCDAKAVKNHLKKYLKKYHDPRCSCPTSCPMDC